MGNWDFSGDEVLFFLAATGAAFIGMLVWYVRLIRLRRPVRTEGFGNKFQLALAPPILLLALLYVLQHWADPRYVVGQLDYILMFLAGGAAWLWFAGAVTRAMGVSIRDDALERGNRAAAVAIAGALAGAMAIYAWCNVGAGPTIWTTLFPAAVATLVWLALWAVVEQAAHVSDAVTIDRDVASAVRLAGWLIASALILGRAMAGDWTSWPDTFGAFISIAWPILPLAFAMIVIQRLLRPTPQTPQPSAVVAGVVPGVMMLIAAVAYVAAQGRPDIGVHVITYEEYMGETTGGTGVER